MFSLALNGIGHGMCLVNTSGDTYCVLTGIGGVWSTQVEVHFVSSLAFKTFCVLAGIVGVCSTHVELHFVSLLAWEVFGQHKSRYILCPSWHWMVLFNIF